MGYLTLKIFCYLCLKASARRFKHVRTIWRVDGQKKGTLRCSRSQRAEKHNTKKTVILPSIWAARKCTEPRCVTLRFLVFASLIPTTNSKLSSLQEAGWTKCCTLGLNSWFHSVLQVRMETATVNQISTCTCAALLYYKWTTLRSHII